MSDNANLPPDIGARIRQAQGRVKTFPRAGTLILPEENTWIAHAMLVKDPHHDIRFDGTHYAAFDGAFAKAFGMPALSDTSNSKFDGLRINIAVMRNFILNHYLASKAITDSDEAVIPLLESIASTLAETLTSEKRGLRAISRTMSIDVVNIEGIGAAKMYAHLTEIQDKPSLLQPLMKMFSKPLREWKLPPIEESPFSMQGLASPPPNYRMKNLPDSAPRNKPTDPDLEERVKEAYAQSAQTQPQQPQAAEPTPTQMDEMADISEAIIETANKLRSVDSLAEPTRDESVEEARKILRWLRNMEFADRDIEEFLDQGAPITVVSKKQSMQKLVRIFAVQLQHAQRRNAALERDSVIDNARDALDAMALTVAEHTRNQIPDNHPRLSALDEMIEAMPESALRRQAQPLTRLLDVIELGLERTTGQEVSDVSVASRLQLLSERINAMAFEMHSSAPPSPPTREESLDLARDMLAKIKSHPFSGKTVDDIVQNATAEQKLAFAQQVHEMADAFRNMISEASMNNPNVLDDPKINEAKTAFGQFSHAISLMAAKEIPNSAAATQQISADVARMPEHWGDLHSRTVDRLVKGAEGALEKTLGDLAMDEDDQQEDLMKEAIESALGDSDRSKRKKKKKRCDSKKRSGKGGKKQKKLQIDITVDDYMLGQGRFAQGGRDERSDARNEPRQAAAMPTAMPVVMPGLRPEDLEVIRQLGGSLRNIGNQLKGLAPAISNVQGGSAVASDDKSAGQRTIEREQQQTTRGPSGPRV